MKSILLLALMAGSVQAASMTKLERQRLVAHLEMTESWLIDEVSGLSDDQLRFHPSPGVWSILDNVEHLSITDPIYWRQFQEAMKARPKGAPDPARDADTLWYGIDRTVRSPAIPSEDIKAKLRDLNAGLEIYRRIHREMLQYARATSDDLRSHHVDRENCDAYQWLLLISTHAQRHILQIREVKADPKFPRR